MKKLIPNYEQLAWLNYAREAVIMIMTSIVWVGAVVAELPRAETLVLAIGAVFVIAFTGAGVWCHHRISQTESSPVPDSGRQRLNRIRWGSVVGATLTVVMMAGLALEWKAAKQPAATIPQTKLLQSLGEEYYRQGKRDQAKQTFETVLKTWIDVEGPDSDDATSTRTDLALVDRDIGRFDEAKANLRIVLRHYLRDSANVLGIANAWTNLALVDRTMGRYDEALMEYDRAMEWYKKLRDPSVHEAWNHVGRGIVLRVQKHFADAEREEKIAIEQFKSRGGETDEIAWAINNLARAEYEAGDFRAADQHLAEVIKTWERSFGLTAPDVTVSLRNRAMVLRLQGKSVAADSLDESAEVMENAEKAQHERKSRLARYAIYDVPQRENDWHQTKAGSNQLASR